MSEPRVLVIDDEPAIRFGIRDFLEAQGFEVDEAESGPAAEARSENRRPDVADHRPPAARTATRWSCCPG